jgi:hypothetical protein
MKCCFVRKVPYRFPGTDRVVWSLILAEREGLTLLFVQKPDGHRSHSIVVATANVEQRAYEDANASNFPVECEDLADIGTKLNAIGDGLAHNEFKTFFQGEDFW